MKKIFTASIHAGQMAEASEYAIIAPESVLALRERDILSPADEAELDRWENFPSDVRSEVFSHWLFDLGAEWDWSEGIPGDIIQNWAGTEPEQIHTLWLDGQPTEIWWAAEAD